MTLIKTSILSFISTVIKILSGIVINKAISIYIGPIGLAFIGQFQSFSQLIMILAQGAINNGVTKYTAEYGDNNEKKFILFGTAAKISLISSTIVSILLVLFSTYFSTYFLHTETYRYIFIIFGFTIVLFVINNLLLSILNGLKEIKTYILINIIQSLYSLIFTTILIIYFSLDGALIALVTNQSIIFLIIIWMLRKHKIINLSNFLAPFDSREAKNLLSFALMALSTAITVPVSHMVIRNFIGEILSWEQAGYWQGIWIISTMYLMIVTTTLSIYFLPKLSELSDKNDLKKEISYGYKIILPIVFISACSIFILKDFIIWMLFSDEFKPMSQLFMWQLIGDFFKIASFIPAYYLLAKQKTKQYIFIQIFFSILFVFLTFYFLQYFNLIGVTQAYAVTYFVCFLYCIYIVLKDLK
jgi:PST family polysaccharide transporter